MEGLMVINSFLLALSLYFIKDFHLDFKNLAKEVKALDEKINKIAAKLNVKIESIKGKIRKLNQ